MKMILNAIKFCLTGFVMGCCFSCSNSDSPADYQGKESIDFDNESYVSISEEANPDLEIKQHYVSDKEEVVKILRGTESVAIVKLGEPVIVAQAEDVYDWGFFQFPDIYYVEDGNLMVSFQMKPDSYTAYGQDSYGRLISSDGGATWSVSQRKYYNKDNSFVEFEDGNILQFYYRDSKDTKEYPSFPEPVNAEPIGGRYFYKESELPEDLRGVYLEYWDKQTNNVSLIHSFFDDPGLLRYSYSKDNLMPILWNGTMKYLSDGTLVASKYPGHYLNSEGKVLDCGISFYKSVDKGYNWKRIGRIPFQLEQDREPDSYVYEGGEGFNEPAFTILKDGSYICVMRTGFYTPMYKSLSKDGGVNWTTPQPFTSNGVYPNLLVLDNGVLVMSSGRPGVQLRFNLDGDGDKWTEPIEMLPFMDENGNYGNRISLWPTCGYTRILAAGEQTFYFVWSDFKRKNADGIERKTILCRKVEVIKR